MNRTFLSIVTLVQVKLNETKGYRIPASIQENPPKLQPEDPKRIPACSAVRRPSALNMPQTTVLLSPPSPETFCGAYQLIHSENRHTLLLFLFLMTGGPLLTPRPPTTPHRLNKAGGKLSQTPPHSQHLPICCPQHLNIRLHLHSCEHNAVRRRTSS